MRITYVAQGRGRVGGIENLSEGLLARLKAECDVMVVDAPILKEVGVASFIWKTVRLARLGATGAVVVCERLQCMPAALLLRWLSRRGKLVLLVYGTEILSSSRWRLKRSLIRQVDTIVAISEFGQQIMRERFGRSDALLLSPLAALGDRIGSVSSQDQKSVRDRLGIAGDEFVVLSVLRVEPNARHKGLASVSACVATLRLQGFQVRHHIVGDGSDWEWYRRNAEAVFDPEVTTQWGRVSNEELVDLYAAADVLALPSAPYADGQQTMVEGFGLVFVEAAVTGTPGIAGRRSGGAEAVVHGETGWVVDGPEDLCGTLRRVCAGEWRLSRDRVSGLTHERLRIAGTVDIVSSLGL